ncbi:hypothetical protein [uncultured Clostridium sp.]|uniref:hypothetical protein n=1 Tax=uncultured Clostridium sp. TaxID=59620 RepID=UPI002671EF2B|nr:hypothetical protein [uncultured Clostridium sp.]
MEQLSFIQIEKTLKDKITKQMKIALNKGIIPGAIVCFDNNKNDRNIVIGLHLGSENKIEARLMSESGNSYMSYPALSDRLKIVGFYEKRN